MLILSIQPHLLSKSIASIATLKSWEPVPSAEYLSVFRHMSLLLHSAAIDNKTKSNLRSAFAPSAAAPLNVSDVSNSSATMTVDVDGQDRKQERGGVTAIDGDSTTAVDQQNRKQSQVTIINNLLHSWIPPGMHTQNSAIVKHEKSDSCNPTFSHVFSMLMTAILLL